MTRRDREQLMAIASFADALPVAIWVGSAASGECVYVNREFERILGTAPPAGAGRKNDVGPYGIYLPSGERYPEDQMPFERAMRSKKTEIVDDIVVHRHDGTQCFLRVFAAPLFSPDGEVAFIVEAFTDMTLEVETERRRAEGERQLQAVRRLESVGSLAGGVAHDFNNLLSVVKLVAGQLRAGEEDLARLDLIRCLDEVADSASKLTRALLGFARRGKHLARQLSVHEIAASVVELAQRTFGTQIEVRGELHAPSDVIVGDPVQVEQIVMNLLMNARDAIPEEGRIVVRTRCETIAQGEHAVVPPGDYLVIEVEDTGTGIDPAVRERVFEPYVTTKISGSLKGTGLGLATVYGSALAHGGVAEIARSSSTGTTMRVLLPAAEMLAAEPQAQPIAAEPGGRGTVLVVDDEPLVLRVMAQMIKSLGYEVITASNGLAAVGELRRAGGKVVLVVLDMVMPGMGARETYLAMRAIQPGVRVVLTTGYALTQDAQKILDLGVRGFVSKPFETSDLAAVLDRVISE